VPATVIATLEVTQSRPAEGATICVGDRVRFEVSVRWDLDFLLAGGVTGNSLTGQTITSFYDNVLGTLSPASASVVWPRGTALFVFTAERAGRGAVVFEADINRRSIFGIDFGGSHLATTRPITVVDCGYRVTAVSRWAVPGEARLVIRAHISEAGLADDGTGRLAGTGVVKWAIEAAPVGDCTGTVTAPNSAVELTGIVEAQELFVDIAYSPTPVTIVINCRGIGGPMTVDLVPAALTVPVAIEGGSLRTPHALVLPEPAAGTSVLIITRLAPR
jgi:hypothetical protein